MLKYTLIPLLIVLSYPTALENDIELDAMRELLDTEIERQNGIDSVKGSVVMYYIGEDMQEFTCGYLRDFEYGARLEIRGILGEILFIVTAENENMMLYSKTSKTAIVAPATRENLTALLGLDIGGNIYQLLDWLSGIVALHSENENLATSVIELTDEKCGVRWVDDAGKNVQEITFSREYGIPLAARLFDERGNSLADVVYSDFEDIDGVHFANSVTVNTSDMRLEVTFKKVTINDKVNPEAFSTEPPSGAEILSLEDVATGDNNDASEDSE